MKEHDRNQIIPLSLYERLCMDNIPYSGYVEGLGYVLYEIIVTPTYNDCSQFGNTISYRRNLLFNNQFGINSEKVEPEFQKNLETPNWDFYAGIVLSESEDFIYDIAKDRYIGMDFKRHSFYEYPSKKQYIKHGRPNDSLKIKKAIKNLGYLVNGYVLADLFFELYSDEISLKSLALETSSITIAELLKRFKGNPYSYAWSIGWELGRIITSTEWYQRKRFLIAYSLWESKYGSPNEINIDLWIYFLESYKETIK